MAVRYTNRLQTDFRACLKDALNDYFGIGEDICPVLYTGQPVPQTSKRCVTFSKLNSRRLGFQGKRLLTDCSEDTGFEEIENWVDEMTFQVNARAKETIHDDVDTPVARDIADGLVTWLNSWAGLERMRESKLFPLRVSEPRNLLSVDESDQFQSTASFDVTVHIGQSRTKRTTPYQEGHLTMLIPVGEKPVPILNGKSSALCRGMSSQ